MIWLLLGCVLFQGRGDIIFYHSKKPEHSSTPRLWFPVPEVGGRRILGHPSSPCLSPQNVMCVGVWWGICTLDYSWCARLHGMCLWRTVLTFVNIKNIKTPDNCTEHPSSIVGRSKEGVHFIYFHDRTYFQTLNRHMLITYNKSQLLIFFWDGFYHAAVDILELTL